MSKTKNFLGILGIIVVILVVGYLIYTAKAIGI